MEKWMECFIFVPGLTFFTLVLVIVIIGLLVKATLWTLREMANLYKRGFQPTKIVKEINLKADLQNVVELRSA